MLDHKRLKTIVRYIAHDPPPYCTPPRTVPPPLSAPFPLLYPSPYCTPIRDNQNLSVEITLIAKQYMHSQLKPSCYPFSLW